MKVTEKQQHIPKQGPARLTHCTEISVTLWSSLCFCKEGPVLVPCQSQSYLEVTWGGSDVRVKHVGGPRLD